MDIFDVSDAYDVHVVSNRNKLNELLLINPDAELFVDVAFDIRYQISNTGRVRNKRTGKFVKVHLHESGYWRITFGSIKSPPYRTCSIHVVVAEAFVPLDLNLERTVVDHRDGNKRNYKWSNLRWVTPKENTVAHYELSQKAFKLRMCNIDNSIFGVYPSTSHCIRAHLELGLKAHGISECCRSNRKSYKGFVFNYIDDSGRVIDGRSRYVPRKLYEDEIFKNVGLFDGKDFSTYEISNYGILRNCREMYLGPVEDAGYLVYKLSNLGQHFDGRAHRLVAHAFVDGRTDERNIVHHKDENRQNNYWKNLEWCTVRENTEYSCARPVQQLTLDGKLVATFRSQKLASENVGCGAPDISSCCTKKRKTAGGYKWQYAQVE